MDASARAGLAAVFVAAGFGLLGLSFAVTPLTTQWFVLLGAGGLALIVADVIWFHAGNSEHGRLRVDLLQRLQHGQSLLSQLERKDLTRGYPEPSVHSVTTEVYNWIEYTHDALLQHNPRWARRFGDNEEYEAWLDTLPTNVIPADEEQAFVLAMLRRRLRCLGRICKKLGVPTWRRF